MGGEAKRPLMAEKLLVCQAEEKEKSNKGDAQRRPEGEGEEKKEGP